MDQMGAFLPLILIFGVFYILLIRPQQKKVKLHREMINNLRRGDKIITSGGIIGSINNSVSGLGTKTDGLTSKSRDQNSFLPIKYGIGMPLNRDSIIDSNLSIIFELIPMSSV